MNHSPPALPAVPARDVPDADVPDADLADAVARLAHASVLVIGDAMLDRYIHGHVTRTSPDAPATPVLTETRELALPGGAANVVRYLTGLGAAAAFISVVGDDPSGSDLTGLVGGQPNVEPWLLVEGGRTTTVKTRYIADGRHLLRADREQTTPIPERLAERVLRIARDAMAATSLTVLSDYGKGVLANGMAARLIAAARETGRPVIVAPPRGVTEAELAAYAGADALVLCAAEAVTAGAVTAGAVTAGAMTAGAARAADAARADRVRAAHGFGAVLLAGPAGLTLTDATGAWSVPAPPAGLGRGGALVDPLIATLAAALAVRLDPPLALRLAGLVAAIVAVQGGAAVVRPDDLLAARDTSAGAPVAAAAGAVPAAAG